MAEKKNTVSFDEWANGAEVKPAKTGILGRAGDLGLSALKSAIAVPETAVGLANLVSGGKAGKAVESAGIRFKDAKDILDAQKSDAAKDAEWRFQNAEGFTGKLGTAVENPSLIANTLVESAAPMLAGGLAGRGLMAIGGSRVAGAAGGVGPALPGAMTRAFGDKAASIAGAAGEGIIGAGSAAEQIRQESTDGELSGKQAALAGASGLATGLLGYGGGKLADRFGVGDIDTALAGGARTAGVQAGKEAPGMLKRIGGGALSEGVFEELPQSVSEQMLQNVALDRDPMQGVDSAAAMGLLSGGLMGGGMGVVSGQPKQQQAAPAQQPVAPGTTPVSPPASTPPAGPTLGQSLTGTPMADLMGGSGLTGGANPLQAGLSTLTSNNQMYPGINTEPTGYTVDPETGAIIPAEPVGVRQMAEPVAQVEAPAPAAQAPVAPALAPPALGESLTGTPVADMLDTRTPSQRMGLNPESGGLTSAAAIAVDSGASPVTAGMGLRALSGAASAAQSAAEQAYPQQQAQPPAQQPILNNGKPFTLAEVGQANQAIGGTAVSVPGGWAIQPTATAQQPAVTPATAMQPSATPAASAQSAILGRNSQPIAEGGQPFSTREEAKAEKRMQPLMRVAPAEGGGFILKPASERQMAAVEKAAKRLKYPSTGETGPRSLHGFILQIGGLASGAKPDVGFDLNPRVGNRRLFSPRGKTIEQAAMAAKQEGYIQDEDENTLIEALKRSLNVSPVYTPDGYEAMAEAHMQARYEDFLAAEQDGGAENDWSRLTPEELAETGYNDYDEATQAEIRALVAQAEALGIDAESILEDVAQRTENATQKDYENAAKSAIEAAIRSSEEGRSRDLGQAGAEAGPATADTQAAPAAVTGPASDVRARNIAALKQRMMGQTKPTQTTPPAQTKATPAPEAGPTNQGATNGQGQETLLKAEQPTGAAAMVSGAPVADTSLNRDSSWVIREKATGKVVMETFDRAKVDALNTAKYEAVPIQQHLAEQSAEQPSDTTKPESVTQKLLGHAKRLGILVNETTGRISASNGTVNIPPEDREVDGAISRDHVISHELGHAAMQKRQISYAGFPAKVLREQVKNWDDLVSASKAHRPDVWAHKNKKISDHARKPNEVIADAIASVLIGNSDFSLLRDIPLTMRDIGLEDTDTTKPGGFIEKAKKAAGKVAPAPVAAQHMAAEAPAKSNQISLGSEDAKSIDQPSKMDGDTVSSLMPFNIAGQKSHLLAESIGGLFETAARTARRVIDAFGGAGTYTHYLRANGIAHDGDILNEFDSMRASAHRQIAKNPDAVKAAVTKFAGEIYAEIERLGLNDGDLFTSDSDAARKALGDWVRSRLEAHVLKEPAPGKTSLTMMDSPELAGIYLVLQKKAVNKIPFQAERTKKTGRIKIPGFLFVMTKGGEKPKGSRVKLGGTVSLFKQDAMVRGIHAQIDSAAQRVGGMDVRTGDGWALISNEARDGDLATVDTSYLNKVDLETGKVEETMNYSGDTEEDADPNTYKSKVEKYLLPAWERGAKLLITNNWDDDVAAYLSSQGFDVRKEYRKGAKLEERTTGAAELIAINFDPSTGKLTPKNRGRDALAAGVGRSIGGAATGQDQQRGGADAGANTVRTVASRAEGQSDAVPRSGRGRLNPSTGAGKADARNAALTSVVRNGGNSTAALSDIAKNSSNPAFKLVAKAILAKGLPFDLRIRTDFTDGKVAHYSTDGHFVEFDPGMPFNLEQVLLHEAVHAVTSKYVASFGDSTPLGKELAALFKLTEQHAKKTGAKFYGLTNADEFLAEVMTNADFSQWLDTVPVPLQKSALSRFVRAVARFFGIQKADGATAQAMDVFERIMLAQSDLQAAASQKLSTSKDAAAVAQAYGVDTEEDGDAVYFGDAEVMLNEENSTYIVTSKNEFSPDHRAAVAWAENNGFASEFAKGAPTKLSPVESMLRDALEATGDMGAAKDMAYEALRRQGVAVKWQEVVDAAKKMGRGTRASKPGADAIRSDTDASPRTPAATIRASIEKAYGNLLSKLEAKGLVTIAQTEREAIEAAAQARADKTGGDAEAIAGRMMSMAGLDVKYSANGNIEGFFDKQTGKSFLVADNLTEASAPGTLMHEVGIHMAADGKMDALFKRAGSLLKTGTQNEFIQRVKARMARAGETSDEEAAAYIVTEYENDRAKAPITIGKWLADLTAAVRAWLFSKGIILKAEQLTVADIAAVARANARSMARGGPNGGPGGGQAFSRQDQEIRFSRAADMAGNAIDKAKQTADKAMGKDFPRAASMPDLNDDQRSLLGKVGASQSPASDAIKAATDRAGLKIRQGMVDRFAALKELDEKALGQNFIADSITNSAWVLAKMSSAGSGALNAMMKSGRIEMDAAQKVIGLKGAPNGGLTASLQKLGGPAEVERFFAWMAANRAEKLMGEGRENLFTPAEIAAGKTLNTGSTEGGKVRPALYSQVHAEFQQYRDDVLAIAEQTGIINSDNRAMWRDEFYVPFYRVMEDDADRGRSGGNGLSRQEAYKKLKGGKQNLNDLMENTLMNFHHLLSASLKNQAAVQAIKNAEHVGIARKVPEARRDTKTSTFVLVDGKKVFYEVDDPLVFESITTLADPGLNNTAVRVMGAFKRLFTNMTTATPQFIIANTFRDLLQASATSPTSKNIAKNLKEGIQSYRDEKTRAEMLASGGAFSFGHIYGMGADEVKESLQKTVAGAGLISSQSMIPSILRKGWDAWGNVTDLSENASRAATYVQNVEQMGKLRAAFEARDVMDFSQHGAWPAVRLLVRIVPFLNARLQGLDKLYRSGVKPSILTAMGKGTDTDKQAAARFAMVTGALTLATMALYLINADDDEYKKLEEWQKDTYWFIRIGENAFFLPKPFEVGAIATMAERTLQQAMDDKATGKLFRERMWDMLMQTFAFNPTPQMFQPLIDVYSNKDAFTGRDIESAGMERMSTGLRSRDTTTAPATALSAVSRVFGDESSIAVSPVQADHLIKGYLGGVGATAAGWIDTMYRAATGQSSPDKAWSEYQPIRRFYRDLDVPVANTRYTTLFFDGLKEANRVYADVMELQKLGRTEEAEALAAEKRSVLQMRIALNAQQRRLTEINNRMKEVRRSDKDGEWKRRELDLLNTQKAMITERMGKRIEDARAGA